MNQNFGNKLLLLNETKFEQTNGTHPVQFTLINAKNKQGNLRLFFRSRGLKPSRMPNYHYHSRTNFCLVCLSLR